MARISEQSTFKPLEKTAFRIGKTLSRRQIPYQQPTPPRRVISNNQYSDLRTTIANTTPAIDRLKNLGQISTPYMGSTKYEPGGRHMGIDIAAPRGTPIESFTGGTVTKMRTGQGWTPNIPSFGNYIIVTTPTGEKVRYSHLYQNFVKMGETIQPGQEIGSIGGTGSTYRQYHKGPGYHLDLRIKNAAGKYLNPVKYLSNI